MARPKRTRSFETPKPDGSFALDIETVQAGPSKSMRMLSPEYLSCSGFFHYQKGSVHCLGENCPSWRHRGDRQWRGYVAAEVWKDDWKLWVPVILEITPHLELDFRAEGFARGQVWQIGRVPTPHREEKYWPLGGQLLERRDPDTFPSCPSIRNTLKRIFRVEELDMGYPNPMPPKTYVRPSKDAPPKHLVDERDRATMPAPPELIERLKERLGATKGVGAALYDPEAAAEKKESEARNRAFLDMARKSGASNGKPV